MSTPPVPCKPCKEAKPGTIVFRKWAVQGTEYCQNHMPTDVRRDLDSRKKDDRLKQMREAKGILDKQKEGLSLALSCLV